MTKRRAKGLVVAMLLLMACHASGAGLHALVLSPTVRLPAPRWQFNKHDKVAARGLAHKLYLIRLAETEQQPRRCLNLVRHLKTKPGLAPWLALEDLKCSVLNAQKNKSWSALDAGLKKVDQHPKWLTEGAAQTQLRNEYVNDSLLLLAQWVQQKNSHVWALVSQLQSHSDWLNKDQQSQFLALAGQVAFLNRRLDAAGRFWQQSLKLKPSAELQAKLDAIRAGKPAPKAAASTSDDLNQLSDGEKKLFQQIKTDLAAHDLGAAGKDIASLLTQYPGGAKSAWAAEQWLNIFVTVAGQDQKKFGRLRSSLLDNVKKCDGTRLYHWAQDLADQGDFVDAAELGKAALSHLKGQPDESQLLLQLGRWSYSSNDLSAARDFLARLVLRFSGSQEAEEALFRLGLIAFESKDYSQAQVWLEKLRLVYPGSADDLSAMYWLWRALEHLKSPKANELAEQIVNEYPLTYYGLRARAELSAGSLVWSQESKSKTAVKITLWLTPFELSAWERFKVLLQAGWFEPAQAELSQLPEPQSPKQKLVMARLYSLAFDHYTAISLAQSAWTDAPDLLQRRYLPLAFPTEFAPFIRRQSKKNTLDFNLVKAIIKQESSFRIHAESPTGAMGLMQLVNGTAREMASYLHWKHFAPDDLFTAQKNIQLGTRYLKQMLRAFDGHVPLALAAYNAGIGRLRRWLRQKGQLDPIINSYSSQPEDELWIEQLPWPETTFYVKSVLRNWLMYRLLSSKQGFRLNQPIWEISKTKR